MSVSLIEKKKCTGCGGCASGCPADCISMQPDDCGFLYPSVDNEKCINCGRCVRICPAEGTKDGADSDVNPEVYAAWSKDEEIRYTSTSGGAFSELAYWILAQNGVVAGAVYNRDNLVEHIILDNAEGVQRLRQSKYVQSNPGMIYRDIRKILADGRKVLFCGTPCQTAALKSYLGREHEDLYTADFICRGVNSPKAYSAWLRQLESDLSSKVTRVWFKYKEYGWKKSPRCTRVDFENGESRVIFAENNMFMRGYLDCNLYLRPSCGSCRFKGVRRYSDITLADFWRIPAELDDDKGTSMLMVNTEKGRLMLGQSADRLVVNQRSFEEIAAGNVCFEGSVQINAGSEDFLRSLDSLPFDTAIKKYLRVTLKTGLKRLVRKSVNKARSLIRNI